MLKRLHHTEEDAVGAAKALLDNLFVVTVADTAFAALNGGHHRQNLPTHRLLAWPEIRPTPNSLRRIVTDAGQDTCGVTDLPRADTQTCPFPGENGQFCVARGQKLAKWKVLAQPGRATAPPATVRRILLGPAHGGRGSGC